MAASSAPFFLTLLTLTQLILAAPVPAAPAPAPVVNLTGILDKGGQYTTLAHLLSVTQIGSQIMNQIKSSDQGLTLLAPTDNAFTNLKPGTLNDLSPQQQVALILYHILPKFYRLQDFDTISNPARTQATGSDGGLYALNFTTTSGGQQVNVSTGIVVTQINNALRTEFPLAVYQLDKVLLPLDLFGAKPPAAAPPPSDGAAADKPAGKSPPSAAASRAPSEQESTKPSGGASGSGVSWRFVLGGGLLVLGALA